MIRPDYIFSYWIIVWYLFYKTEILTYNPKFALYVGLCENVWVLGAMIYHKVILRNILFFIVIILFFKVIPLWTLRNTEFNKKDIHATFSLFILYFAWLLWNKKLDVFSKSYTEMLKTHNHMPGMTLFSKLYNDNDKDNNKDNNK